MIRGLLNALLLEGYAALAVWVGFHALLAAYSALRAVWS